MRKSSEVFGKLWELNPIWDKLSPDQKEFVEGNTEIRHFRKNDMIHHEGDASTHIMMVISGTVRLYKEGVGQRIQIIRFLKPHDLFGYRGAILGDPHTSSASAVEAVNIYCVRRETFVQMVKQNNDFCFAIMRCMAEDLANSESHIVNLTQKHVRGRLAESLLSLQETYGFDEDGVTIAMYMSREDLANMSNMTTSNAIRTLSQFASEGLIGIDGRKIKLLNPNEVLRISRMG